MGLIDQMEHNKVKRLPVGYSTKQIQLVWAGLELRVSGLRDQLSKHSATFPPNNN